MCNKRKQKFNWSDIPNGKNSLVLFNGKFGILLKFTIEKWEQYFLFFLAWKFSFQIIKNKTYE